MTKLNINDRYQLIDLNKNNIMFDINLVVNASGDEEFQACIVSQNQLDNGEEPEFRNFKGKMKVHLKNLDESSEHETQYLCIKKVDGNIEVEYDIIYNDLPEKEPQDNDLLNVEKYQPPIPKKKKTIFTIRNLIILAVVVIIGFLLYKFWTRKSKKTIENVSEKIKETVEEVTENVSNTVEEVVENASAAVEPVKEVVEKVKETIKSPSLNSSDSELDFLAKLKKLQSND
jgi:hypothetical protein